MIDQQAHLHYDMTSPNASEAKSMQEWPTVERNSIEAMSQLFQALVKAQAQMRSALKDSINPHFKNKYADLKSIWDAIREPLTSNGLCILQELVPVGGDPTQLQVWTILAHTSGAERRSVCPVYAKDWGNPQAVGSAISYARRYSLTALIGVVADDDDDGNSAATPDPRQTLIVRVLSADPWARNLTPTDKRNLLDFISQDRSAMTESQVAKRIESWKEQHA